MTASNRIKTVLTLVTMAVLVLATPSADAAIILSTDFSGRTVTGDTASTITWTTNGVLAPGDLTAVEEDGDALDELAGLYDTPAAQGYFAPDLNVGNEGPWSISLTLNLTVAAISLEEVVLDYQHFTNSGTLQGVGREVDWTVTVTGAVSGELGSMQVQGASNKSGTETIVFTTPLMLTNSESYDVTILAEGPGPGNNTALGAVTFNGVVPEPATMSLLALAGLAALVRRRRNRA